MVHEGSHLESEKRLLLVRFATPLRGTMILTTFRSCTRSPLPCLVSGPVYSAMQLFQRVFTRGRSRRCQDPWWRECIRHRPTGREVRVPFSLNSTLCRPLLTDIKLLRTSGKKHTSPPSSARSCTLMTRHTISKLIVGWNRFPRPMPSCVSFRLRRLSS